MCLRRAFGRARLRPEATRLPRGSPPAVPPVPPRPGPAREGHEPGVQRPDTRMRAPAAAQASAFPGSAPARSAPLSPRCVPPAFRENRPPRRLARPPTPASAGWWKTLADRHARPSAAAGPTPTAGCGADPPHPTPRPGGFAAGTAFALFTRVGHHQHAADAPAPGLRVCGAVGPGAGAAAPLPVPVRPGPAPALTPSSSPAPLCSGEGGSWDGGRLQGHPPGLAATSTGLSPSPAGRKGHGDTFASGPDPRVAVVDLGSCIAQPERTGLDTALPVA